MDQIEKLEKISVEEGLPLVCARRKDQSWIIYISPHANDRMGLLLNAALQIEKTETE
jgi:hypothetical protein